MGHVGRAVGFGALACERKGFRNFASRRAGRRARCGDSSPGNERRAPGGQVPALQRHQRVGEDLHEIGLPTRSHRTDAAVGPDVGIRHELAVEQERSAGGVCRANQAWSAAASSAPRASRSSAFEGELVRRRIDRIALQSGNRRPPFSPAPPPLESRRRNAAPSRAARSRSATRVPALRASAGSSSIARAGVVGIAQRRLEQPCARRLGRGTTARRRDRRRSARPPTRGT